MSILLDALSRKTQNQDKLSGQGYAETPKRMVTGLDEVRRYTGLRLGAALGIGALLGALAAWGITEWFSATTPPIAGRDALLANNVSVLPSQKHDVKQESAFSPDEIMLAGKVALPVAQPRPVMTSEKHRQSGNEHITDNASHGMDLAIVHQDKQVSDGEKIHQALEPLVLGATSDLSAAQLDTLAKARGTAVEGMPVLGADKPKHQDQRALVAEFQKALKEVEYQHALDQPVSPNGMEPVVMPKADGLPKLTQLPPVLRRQVPKFTIIAHVYASSPKNRWLNVDGQEVQQGDTIAGKLKIVEIRPRDVVLAMDNTRFTVPAI